jgi:hypothetical protein
MKYFLRFFFIGLTIFGLLSWHIISDLVQDTQSLMKFDDVLSSFVSSKVYTGYELYNKPDVSNSESRFIISTDNPPAGFQFNFVTNPKKVYKFTLAGKKITGYTQIRVTPFSTFYGLTNRSN